MVASRDLHRGGWVVALRADTIARPGADHEEPFERYVLEHPGAALVLAVDDHARVCCLRQYRHAARRRFLELPAGLCDVHGEDPLEVARRELREEAGLAAEEWTPLLSTYSSPGISDEVIHAFVARGLREVGRGDFELEHEEADFELVWVPVADLWAAVLDGRVQDAPVCLAVLAAGARGMLGSEYLVPGSRRGDRANQEDGL